MTRILALTLALSLAGGACGGSQAEVDATTTPKAASMPEASSAPEGKLPEGVRPTSYQLSLRIVPEEDTFSGAAVIGIELDAPSREIWMHGQNLDVTAIHAMHGTTRIEASWSQKTADGVALVELAEPLPAGRSTLHIDYGAGFDTPLRGLYRVHSGGNAYAFTQFESISARLAFPCFDEPRFKTPFEVTLTVPEDHVAAANTPIDRAIPLPDGLQRVSFTPTRPISTYLVALTVGPLDVVEGATMKPSATRPYPVPLRGLAAEGRGEHLRYALERSEAQVVALEDYFGVPYPYRKLDLVAVPDFAAGAMENVGLITFREWLLLLDKKRATENQRRAFAYVLAHELAHQWFGNLVTMPWWDDIWLNEAFATWMGSKVVETLHPEYRSDLGSLASSHRAMQLDTLQSARSIRQPIESNHDIKNAFDAITYEKGGAVLSMFERWLGADTFREGIRLYIRRHQNETATSEDLLAALDEVTELDVAAPFRTFLTQPGVPLLSTRTNGAACEDGARKVALRQERYFPIGSSGDAAQRWDIPFCVRHANGTTCALLSEPEGQIELPGCPSWWMPNDDGAGYFRFSMSPDDWSSLRTRGFSKLSDRGKMAVADSVIAELDRGAMDAEALLPWLPRFVASPIRQVASAPMGPLRFMMYHAAPPERRDEVRRYASRLYRRRYERLGWRAAKKESSDTKLLRDAVVRFMVMDVRDSAARAKAARLGRAYIGYRTKARPAVVDPQLAGLALATAVQEGDARFFDYLLSLLDEDTDALARNRILSALAHAERPALSTRALELSLDPRVRINEIGRMLRVQLRNPQTRERAWEWFTEHFDEVTARLGSGRGGGTPWHATGFCTEDAAERVRRFFEPRVAALAGGPRNLAGAVEAISLCAKRAAAQRPGVERAFGAR